MTLFRKGDKVVKILSGAGLETATIQTISEVKKRFVMLEGGGLTYDPLTGYEIDPTIMGFSSRLIVLESE